MDLAQHRPRAFFSLLAVLCLGACSSSRVAVDGGDADAAARDGAVRDEGSDQAAPADAPPADSAGSDATPAACAPAPLVERAVAVESGEQIAPKLAPAGGGKSWVSWYSLENGNYNVRAQLIDGQARPLLPGGVLVSQHPSDSWVTDYSLVADRSGAAIVVFNDMRNGNFDVFAQKVTPSGALAWGADGATLGGSSDGDMTPRAVLCDNDEVVAAWARVNDGDTVQRVVLQRLAADGKRLWGDGLLIGEGPGKAALRPWLVAAPGGAVIVVWIESPGIMSYERTIRARKLDAAGQAVWPNDAVVVEHKDMPFFYDPVLEPDGAGGVFVAWTALVNSVQAKSYVQHVDAAGQLLLPVGGVACSTSAYTQQYDPALVYLPDAAELVVVWRESDMSQAFTGLSAQRFDAEGNRGWPETGLELVDTTAAGVHLAGARRVGDEVAVFYRVAAEPRLFGARLALAAKPPWAPVELSPPQGEKMHPTLGGDPDCGQWIAWGDARADNGDIYAAFLAVP